MLIFWVSNGIDWDYDRVLINILIRCNISYVFCFDTNRTCICFDSFNNIYIGDCRSFLNRSYLRTDSLKLGAEFEWLMKMLMNIFL
jgi:hypothetical protein